jgi:hypothetical protein
MRLPAALLTCALALPAIAVAQQSTPPDTADPNLFLEEMTGARAMAWVKQENEKTAAVLEKDPRYASILKAAVTMASAKDRLPYVEFLGDSSNFWRDENCAGSGGATLASPHGLVAMDGSLTSTRAGGEGESHGASLCSPAIVV